MAAENFNISHWTKDHFIIFIFICIADSDNSLDKSELLEIAKHIESVDDIPTVLKDVHSVVKVLPEEYRIGLIQNHKNQFNLTTEEIESTLGSIEEIILADTSIEREEIAMYSKIKRALKS